MVKDVLKALCNVFSLNLCVSDPVLRAPSHMTSLSTTLPFKVSMLGDKNQKGITDYSSSSPYSVFVCGHPLLIGNVLHCCNASFGSITCTYP